MAASIEWKSAKRGHQPALFALACSFKVKDRGGDAGNGNHDYFLMKRRLCARLVFSDPITFNAETLLNEHELTDSVVVTKRGECSFAEKYQEAVRCGAVCVIIANSSGNHGVISPAGEINSSFSFEVQHGDSVKEYYPPCFMISNSAYRRLRHDHPAEVVVTPLKGAIVNDLPVTDLGAALRGVAAHGVDKLCEDILGNLLAREGAPNDILSTKSVLKSALADKEAGRGANALHIAVESSKPTIVKLLLDAGANTELTKDDGYTALHIAAEYNLVDCVECLLQAGAYVDNMLGCGWTAVHIASHHGNFETLQCLIEAGANVNIASNDGNTALHVSCFAGHTKVVKALLDAGAYVSKKSLAGFTAKTVAIYAHHPLCAALIEQLEASGQQSQPKEPNEYEESEFLTKLMLRKDSTLYKTSGEPSDWKTILPKGHDVGSTEASDDTERNAGVPRRASQDLLAIDLERCCFIEYRVGVRKDIVFAAAQRLLAEKSDVVSDETASEGFFYRQGLLSLLPPISEHLINSLQRSTDSELLNAKKESLSLQTTTLFRQFLTAFPTIKKYFGKSGTVEVFVPVFDSSIRLLSYWAPVISKCLVWSELSPSLFAVPWVTTLMADVLPTIEQVMRLWTGLFEMHKNAELNHTRDVSPTVGDNILAVLIASVLIMHRNQILKVVNFSASRSSPAGTNTYALPLQESLLMLFASINNSRGDEMEGDGTEDDIDAFISRRGYALGGEADPIDVDELIELMTALIEHTPDSVFTQRKPSDILAISDESVSTKEVADGHANDTRIDRRILDLLGDVPALTLREVSLMCLSKNVLVVNFDEPGNGVETCSGAVNNDHSEGDAKGPNSSSILHSKAHDLVSILEGSANNIKVVSQKDLKMAGLQSYLQSLADQVMAGRLDARAAVTSRNLPLPFRNAMNDIKSSRIKDGEPESRNEHCNVDEEVGVKAPEIAVVLCGTGTETRGHGQQILHASIHNMAATLITCNVGLVVKCT
jgi:hypothetical protein